MQQRQLPTTDPLVASLISQVPVHRRTKPRGCLTGQAAPWAPLLALSTLPTYPLASRLHPWPSPSARGPFRRIRHGAGADVHAACLRAGLRPLRAVLRIYREHRRRMHYRQYRDAGMTIGSGAIESTAPFATDRSGPSIWFSTHFCQSVLRLSSQYSPKTALRTPSAYSIKPILTHRLTDRAPVFDSPPISVSPAPVPCTSCVAWGTRKDGMTNDVSRPLPTLSFRRIPLTAYSRKHPTGYAPQVPSTWRAGDS